jgi:hypothetical protein
MGNYYYLAASLPPLEFPSMPDVSFVSLREALKLNLSKSDLKKVETLRLFIDISNIRPLLLEEEIDPRGNLEEKELDEALLVHNLLPGYVFEFLDQHETLADKLKYFPELLARFFAEEIPKQTGFLKAYFTFEREWRLVVLALRAKKMKRDLIRELQFEDVFDPFVAHILAQKDAESYEPPIEYKDLKDILHACGPDPWEQNKAIAAYRFNKIQEMIGEAQFSIDWILAYLAQLLIIEYWNELDAAKGQMILDTFKTS